MGAVAIFVVMSGILTSKEIRKMEKVLKVEPMLLASSVNSPNTKLEPFVTFLLEMAVSRILTKQSVKLYSVRLIFGTELQNKAIVIGIVLRSGIPTFTGYSPVNSSDPKELSQKTSQLLLSQNNGVVNSLRFCKAGALALSVKRLSIPSPMGLAEAMEWRFRLKK
jgi:hypothetical protein